MDSGFDLFRGTAPIQTLEDRCVSTPYVSIKVNKTIQIDFIHLYMLIYYYYYYYYEWFE